MLVSDVGMGILFVAIQFAVQGSSTTKDLASVVAMFSFFRSFGNALEVAVGSTIFQNQMKKLLASPRWADQASLLAKDSASLVQTITLMPAGPDKTDLRTAYARSFIASVDLDRTLEAEQGFIQDEKVSSTKAAEEGIGGRTTSLCSYQLGS